MTRPIEYVEMPCPYCGETCLMQIEAGPSTQEYTEDCQVCCRPMVVKVRMEPGADTPDLELLREDE